MALEEGPGPALDTCADGLKMLMGLCSAWALCFVLDAGVRCGAGVVWGANVWIDAEVLFGLGAVGFTADADN